MKRSEQLSKLKNTQQWDVIIIGGGASGLGTALDAASRGYKTILLEAVDFAKGTSSRSTKLVHGGVRYLEQGNIHLVIEALKERGLLAKNAGHLVKNQSF
ncbi:MAG: FAD-dependent oxidoreductase, partial [Flavobacterium sp.]